jgi:hypothetical protein
VCPQDDFSLSDAIGVTSTGAEYAIKWPKGYRKVVVDQSKAQSLAEAFSWPSKAKVNLEKLTEQIGSEFKPVLLADRELTVSSNFSGVCSQSRGTMVLQAHGFGKCRFRHVSFCEKAKQCQHKLVRDFPNACVYTDQLHLLHTDTQLELHNQNGFEAMCQFLDAAPLNHQLPCFRHNGFCPQVFDVDLNLFGAPCVADSTMGKCDKDDGVSRKVSCTEL